MAAFVAQFCPAVLYSGACAIEGCSLKHDVNFCSLCAVICHPALIFESHRNGKRHRANIAAGDALTTVRCPICDIRVSGQTPWIDHIAGAPHRNKAARQGRSPHVFPDDPSATVHAKRCLLCKRSILVASFSSHLQSGDHRKREQYAAYQATYEQAERDKQGVTMSHVDEGVNFGVVDLNDSRRGVSTNLTISSTVRASRISILRVDTSSTSSAATPFSVAVQGPTNKLEYGKNINLLVTFRSVRCGRFEGRVEVVFEDVSKRRFVIVRQTRATVGNSADHQLLQAEHTLHTKETCTVECWPKLPKVPIPEYLSTVLGNGTPEQILQSVKEKVMPKEHRMVADLRMFDMIDVQFTKEGRFYTLPVPGLAEKRPSVIVGDVIEAQIAGGTSTRTFEGYVHIVRLSDICIGFSSSFKPGAQQFNVQAVQSVLAGVRLFIIFGPPGTGKTVTVVEAIRQILHRNPNARILACAPSNSAADIIAQRLMMLSRDELFRYNAVSRQVSTVPQELREYTHTAGEKFSLHPKEKLSKFKVIVSTCVSASFAHGIGLPNGHFTHIFVDEAGQATEPEVMTAIKPMAGAKTQVVLSGDPKQLGPVIRSVVARELGFGKSYLERLMELPLYNEKGLVKNFRSHKAILNFPNERFYNNELQVCGAPKSINSFIGSPLLPSKSFPVIFHAISGQDQREASSPSYFNIDEITEVRDYVQALLADRRFPVAAKDIGIIAPYHAQVRKIRRALEKVKITDVKVGSVEEFQGQERRVIIVSTVRSSQNLIQYDAKYTLGFVSNPRRFNVAITRAQALLIVVGDPSVLSIDPLWRSFMNYVHLSGGWKGEAITWDPHVPVKEDGTYDQELREVGAANINAFMVRMEGLTGDGEAEQDMEGEANEDRGPWREVE
ncbi:putative helicase mov-10-B.1 [Grifola frondosa]|uniref:RNA helicase n=1 Tax=Grifola frondosa TaxID=5627 RepID=A0A1C7ML75_GRIFR|nr:putative helicase mov-10-B.1 [Grifola frondosa]